MGSIKLINSIQIKKVNNQSMYLHMLVPKRVDAHIEKLLKCLLAWAWIWIGMA